jgi:hypothetical protein
MSNYRAIATVTTVLRYTLQDAVTSVASASVTTDSPTAHTTTSAAVNVFLYSVAANAALRNADLPTRRSDGGLAQRPQAALDLRYLLSFYGKDSELEPQRLLGKVTAVLHAHPVITQQAIRNTLAKLATTPPDYLAGSDLADAVETVRLMPLQLSVDELSRLWSMFPQTPYALSVAYGASVVLIELEEFPEPALPVRDYRVYAVPFRRPVILSVEAESGPRDPILHNSKLLIRGENLTGETTLVRLAGLEVPVQGAPDCLRLDLATLPANALRAGAQGIQVVHRQLMGEPPTPHIGTDSNLVAFVLHPVIANAQIVTPPGSGPELTVDVTPAVRAGQRTAILLNGTQGPHPAAARIEIPPGAADRASLRGVVDHLPAGIYLVRVQVDGAESLLSYDPNLPGYSGPKVTIL